MADNDINRLKVILAEQKKTAKWLAGQLGKDPATVSKWCTNKSQLGVETFRKMAEILDVDMKDMFNSSKGDDVVNVIIRK